MSPEPIFLNLSLFLFFSRENTKAVKSHVSRIGPRPPSRVACTETACNRARGQEGPYDRAEFTKENQNTAGNPIATELLLQRMPPAIIAGKLRCLARNTRHHFFRQTASQSCRYKRCLSPSLHVFWFCVTFVPPN